jgi:hypothetical protein
VGRLASLLSNLALSPHLIFLPLPLEASRDMLSLILSSLSLSLYSSPRTLVVGVVLPFLAGEEE